MSRGAGSAESKTIDASSTYKAVPYALVVKGSDYEAVTLPYYRRRAAMQIQRRFRRHIKAEYLRGAQYHPKIEQEFKSQRYADESLLAAVPTLREPIEPDYAFLFKMHNHLNANRLHSIDYSHNDFTRHLFLALRLNLIDRSQLSSVKLMYEAVCGFPPHHSLSVDASAQIRFKRYPLRIGQGPYDPASISYITKEHLAELQCKIDDDVDSTLHYYTLDLPRQHVAWYLAMIIYQRVKTEKVVQLLRMFINKHASLAMRTKYLRLADRLGTDYRGKIKPLYNFLSSEARGLGCVGDKSMAFLSAIYLVQSQVPSTVLADGHREYDSASPTLSLVLPTQQTLSVLQSIVHTDEATEATPVVGEETPRMIRAFDEIPALSQQVDAKYGCNEALYNRALKEQMTTVQQLLALLYPSVMHYRTPSRPTEITHPDLPKTNKPHNYDCNDFMLSWHDVFHAWRNGENFKLGVRRLRTLLDERGGLAVKQSGMSKALWELTDMDSSMGKFVRDKGDAFEHALMMMHYFNKARISYAPSSDVNALFMHDILSEDFDWQAVFGAVDLDAILDIPGLMQHISDTNPDMPSLANNIQSANNNFAAPLRVQLKQIANVQAQVQSCKKRTRVLSLDVCLFALEKRKFEILAGDREHAGAIELALLDQLQLKHNGDRELVDALKRIGFNELFYWSDNSGLYFKKSLRGMLKKLPVDFNPRLRAMKALDLRLVLMMLAREQLSPAMHNEFKSQYLIAIYARVREGLPSCVSFRFLNKHFIIDDSLRLVARQHGHEVAVESTAILAHAFVVAKSRLVRLSIIMKVLRAHVTIDPGLLCDVYATSSIETLMSVFQAIATMPEQINGHVSLFDQMLASAPTRQVAIRVFHMALGTLMQGLPTSVTPDVLLQVYQSENLQTKLAQVDEACMMNDSASRAKLLFEMYQRTTDHQARKDLLFDLVRSLLSPLPRFMTADVLYRAFGGMADDALLEMITFRPLSRPRHQDNFIAQMYACTASHELKCLIAYLEYSKCGDQAENDPLRVLLRPVDVSRFSIFKNDVKKVVRHFICCESAHEQGLPAHRH